MANQSHRPQQPPKPPQTPQTNPTMEITPIAQVIAQYLNDNNIPNNHSKEPFNYIHIIKTDINIQIKNNRVEIWTLTNKNQITIDLNHPESLPQILQTIQKWTQY